MFGRKKGLVETGESWVYAGIYCSKHVSEVVKALGKAMFVVVDIQNVAHDDRCSVVGCGEHISTVAFRDVQFEMKRLD